MKKEEYKFRSQGNSRNKERIIQINYWTIKCKEGFRITTLKPTGKDLITAVDGISLPNEYIEKNKVLDIVGVLPKFSSGLFLDIILENLKFQTLKTNGGIFLSKKAISVQSIEFYNTPYLDNEEKIQKYLKNFEILLMRLPNLEILSSSNYFAELILSTLKKLNIRLKCFKIRQSENIVFDFDKFEDVSEQIVYHINKYEIVKIKNNEKKENIKYKYAGIEYDNFDEIKIEEVEEVKCEDITP